MESGILKQKLMATPSPRYDQYLTHSICKIALVVTAMDSFFILVMTHGYGIASGRGRDSKAAAYYPPFADRASEYAPVQESALRY